MKSRSFRHLDRKGLRTPVYLSQACKFPLGVCDLDYGNQGSWRSVKFLDPFNPSDEIDITNDSDMTDRENIIKKKKKISNLTRVRLKEKFFWGVFFS